MQLSRLLLVVHEAVERDYALKAAQQNLAQIQRLLAAVVERFRTLAEYTEAGVMF